MPRFAKSLFGQVVIALVLGVLASREADIDRMTREMTQLAGTDRAADRARHGDPFDGRALPSRPCVQSNAPRGAGSGTRPDAGAPRVDDR